MSLLKSVVLVAVTAVVVRILPSYLSKPLPKVGSGYAAPGWRKAADAFRDNLDSGLEKGGSFALYHQGELVVEFSGGYAHLEAEWAWNKDIVTPAFSATKGVSAIIVAMLVDRGLLDYDTEVAYYWPEFAQNGKDGVTVRQLVSHQAGLPVLDEKFTIQDIRDEPDKVSRILAQQKPLWDPGSAHGFHSISYGLYIDQLVRRVDPQHRDISQFMQDEIAQPFGIDFYIGLPLEENFRCAHVYMPSMVDSLLSADLGILLFMVDLVLNPANLLMKTATNPAGGMEYHFNNPFVRAIPCGSSRGFGTATALAKLYGIIANGGEHDRKRLLSAGAIQEMVTVATSGMDRVLPINSTYGAGMMLRDSPLGTVMFGTPGHGGQMGFGDLKYKIGWAYLTNHLRLAHVDPRYTRLERAIYQTLAEMENNR